MRVLHLDSSVLEVQCTLLQLKFDAAIVAKSRQPIPSRKEDRLVATVLLPADLRKIFELQNFMCGEVLRNDDIVLPFQVLGQDLCWRVEVTCTRHYIGACSQCSRESLVLGSFDSQKSVGTLLGFSSSEVEKFEDFLPPVEV
jgi:hypothetical protein